MLHINFSMVMVPVYSSTDDDDDDDDDDVDDDEIQMESLNVSNLT